MDMDWICLFSSAFCGIEREREEEEEGVRIRGLPRKDGKILALPSSEHQKLN